MQTHKFKFNGEGSTYFRILLTNWILTALTLGLYYPWSKANLLQYKYASTELGGSRFSFLGKGKEMFKGFIKGYLIIGTLYAILLLGVYSKTPLLVVIGVLIFIVGFLFLIPFAVHGMLKYRLAKSEYRGIRMAYTGKLSEFIVLYFKGVFLTIITFTIYSSWFEVDLRKYVFDHIKVGNLNLKFTGKGEQYFGIRLISGILIMLTLGIYTFWYLKKMLQFQIDNVKIIQDTKEISVKSTITVSQIFTSILFYGLGFITLGIALPWAIMNSMKIIIESIEIDTTLDLNKLEPFYIIDNSDPLNPKKIKPDENDATGDDISDMINFDI